MLYMPVMCPAFTVNAFRYSRCTRHHGVGRNIAVQACVHAHKRMRTDLAELMYDCLATEDNPVAHMHMTGERRAVRHDGFVADDAVVGDVYVSHDPVVIAYDRHALVLSRTATDRYELVDRIAITYLKARRFAGVLLVLRIVANRRKLVDQVVLANRCRPINNHVTFETSTIADLDVVADDGIRTDLDVVADLRGLGNDSSWVDHSSSFLTLS